MKIEKFREMSRTDLERKLHELRDAMLKTEVKIQTKQVENTAQLSTMRKDIARILTLLKQQDKQGTTPVAAAPAVEAPKAKAATDKKK
jgi:large subunit ribosomal protein L29